MSSSQSFRTFLACAQKCKLEEEDYRGERFKDYHKDIKGNNDILSLSQPAVITKIHEQYLEAGSDIIETNTFSGTRIAQADYDMQDLTYEINKVRCGGCGGGGGGGVQTGCGCPGFCAFRRL